MNLMPFSQTKGFFWGLIVSAPTLAPLPTLPCCMGARTAWAPAPLHPHARCLPAVRMQAVMTLAAGAVVGGCIWWVRHRRLLFVPQL
jgi:hypothetical protein